MSIHPRDPEGTLEDKVEIIQGLKDMNYSILSYSKMIRVERETKETTITTTIAAEFARSL